ncbi:MAG TPA: hypothetical protein VK574_14680 [Terracidiphilus sp.]|nr:hypothetical protein [Terracidiphilus sp.]
MGSQVYRENYLAAVEGAHSQLDEIIREFDSLQLRKEQIEGVVGALQPFLRTAPQASYEVRQPDPVHHEFHQPEPIQAEPVRVAPEPEIVKQVLRVAPVPAPEPVAPAAFSPVSESKLDPIQNRINRALGLAVA